MKRKIRGLTLIELMVVVAVLAVLSAIVYPLYTEQARKARRTEGRAALMTLAQAQERFYTVNGSYSNDPVALGVTTSAPGGKYKTDKGYYEVSTTGGATFTATATAIGGQSGDTDCKAMTIDNLGVKGGSGADPGKCW